MVVSIALLVPLFLLISSSGYYLFIAWTTSKARRKLSEKNLCRPLRYYPHSDPFLGLDLFFEDSRMIKSHNYLSNIEKRYQRLGTTFACTTLGRTIIHTVEPENLKAILAINHHDFVLSEKRRAALYPLLGTGIFTTEGAEWAHSRALLRLCLERRQIANVDIFETHVQELLAQIPPNGETVDMMELFFRLTMDTSTEFLFGESVGSLSPSADNSATEFAHAFEFAQKELGRRSRLGHLYWLLGGPQFDRSVKFCHEFVERYVQSALSVRQSAGGEKSLHSDAKAKRHSFIWALGSSTTDKDKIRNEVLNLLLAGRDTTASLLSSSFFILAKRSDVFRRLREEVLELGTGAPTYDDLKGLKYLRYFLNEVLRLYPIVPSNQRTATRDVVLPTGGGADGKSPVLVMAGQTVFYSVYTMHRRKDIYGDDADIFRPERWENELLRPGWAFLPFNGGPRICIGQQFALVEVSYVIVRMLQAIRSLESRHSGPWEESLTLTLSPRYGCKVGVVMA